MNLETMLHNWDSLFSSSENHHPKAAGKPALGDTAAGSPAPRPLPREARHQAWQALWETLPGAFCVASVLTGTCS